MNLHKLCFFTLCIGLASSALLLNGCQSNIDEIATKTHGSKAGDGYTYGTGPNKTRPYPQSEKVNINGVGGAKPKYEPVSRGGNKDYTVLGQNYMVWTNCHSYQEVGTASWYGPGFHGNKTSNGEVYNQKGYTAAHKNLPLPSYLKVTNLENGRAVIVRVNDRGPFHGSRIIDLSEGAAKAIDMTRKGTAKVKLELIDVRNGLSNVYNSDEPGQKPGIGIINQVLDKTLSSTTKQKLENLGEFSYEMKANNGKVSAETAIAAAGSAIYFAKKLDAAADKVAAEQAQMAKSHSAASSRSVNTVTETTTTTTTNIYADGDSTTTKQVKVVNYPVNSQVDERTTVADFEINYSTPETSVTLGDGYIQLFSSSSQQNAVKIQEKLKKQTNYPVIVVAEEGLYRVRIGPVAERELSTTLEYLKQLGYKDAFIKRK